MDVLLLNGKEVENLLPMDACVDAMEHAFREAALGRALDRPRSHSYFPTDQQNRVYLFKSFEGGIISDGILACRLCSYINEFVHVHESYQVRRAAGAYAERGMLLLFSMETAEPLCIMPERHIQGSRVAATAALGTRCLARKDSKVLGIYGSGLQARYGVVAHSLVGSFEKVRVYSPTPEHRETFGEQMEPVVGIEIEVVDDPREVMRGADVVLGATSSIEPVIRGDWLESGMQITAINKCVDQEGLDRIELFARSGGGQPQNFYCGPVEVGNREEVESKPVMDLSQTIALGDLLLGRFPGRTSDDQITSFGQHTGGEGGRGIQFAAAGAHVYRKAREKGVGRYIELDWF